MKNRPLGCFTFSALLFVLLAVLAVGAAMVLSGNSIFSPGELSALTVDDGGGPIELGGVTSHAQLGTRCDSCHTAIWSGEVMGDRCLACHTDVAQQMASRNGLHGRMDATAATCRACHTDHLGATASATRADVNVFPHEDTGFALTAHLAPAVAQGISCRECHHDSAKGDYERTDCVGCHQSLDQAKMATHTDTYGPACLNCHDGKDTYGRSFAHTSYALTGKHASTATCDSCHHGNTTLTALRSTPTECATCHGSADIHEGRLGTDCATCHTPDGWQDATLDHTTQTRFVLTGEHIEVDCAACHVDRHWTGIGTTCIACHQKDDEHEGSLGTDCAACHDTHGWDDAAFNHDLTGFPLKAAHADLECGACHQNGQFHDTPATCNACHDSPASHVTYFGPNCATCHTESAWTPASFNHAVTSWNLTGGHALVVCQKCHPEPTTTFRGASTICAACHTKPASHTGAMAANCGTCHSTRAWEPATFDHSDTRFALTGAHTGLTCVRCHTNPNTFGGLSTLCAACHAKPASHTAAMGGNCATCHSTRAWEPATFDHSQTRFALTNAHNNLTCARCHTNPNTFGGLTPTCAACHTKPSNHTAAMGSNCDACHSTRAWTPATFDHSRSGFPLTNAHAGLTCTKCHTNPNTFGGLSSACASCHSKPPDHPANTGNNCGACHTTKDWSSATFDHAAAGFPLTGGHANLLCAKCHTNPNTFGGLSTACNSCHSKPADHPANTGNNCGACHTTKDWSSATFDHAAAGFPLTGGHANLTCSKCHTNPNTFGGLSTDCVSCHSKPNSHPSFYWTQCTRCHTTSAFKPISYTAQHTFPLSHGGAAQICTKCHLTSFDAYNCGKCHDPSRIEDHAGRSLSNCASCHPTGREGGDALPMRYPSQLRYSLVSRDSSLPRYALLPRAA